MRRHERALARFYYAQAGDSSPAKIGGLRIAEEDACRMMENHTVAMIRDSVVGLPVYEIWEPFGIRRFRPGDEHHWTRLHIAADPYNTFTPETFTKQFGTDTAKLADRQFYLLDSAKTPIGTATAWELNGFGLVHWVAIVPEYQGQGLAKPLLSAVCERLGELGYSRLLLHTSSGRVPALNLYLHFNFRPHIRTPLETTVWQALQPRLKYATELFM